MLVLDGSFELCKCLILKWFLLCWPWRTYAGKISATRDKSSPFSDVESVLHRLDRTFYQPFPSCSFVAKEGSIIVSVSSNILVFVWNESPRSKRTKGFAFKKEQWYHVHVALLEVLIHSPTVQYLCDVEAIWGWRNHGRTLKQKRLSSSGPLLIPRVSQSHSCIRDRKIWYENNSVYKWKSKMRTGDVFRIRWNNYLGVSTTYLLASFAPCRKLSQTPHHLIDCFGIAQFA